MIAAAKVFANWYQVQHRTILGDLFPGNAPGLWVLVTSINLESSNIMRIRTIPSMISTNIMIQLQHLMVSSTVLHVGECCMPACYCSISGLNFKFYPQCQSRCLHWCRRRRLLDRPRALDRHTSCNWDSPAGSKGTTVRNATSTTKLSTNIFMNLCSVRKWEIRVRC